MFKATLSDFDPNSLRLSAGGRRFPMRSMNMPTRASRRVDPRSEFDNPHD